MADARAIRGRYCLIGGDVSASVSPEMMNAAFSHLGFEESYFALSLGRNELVEWFGRLKTAGVLGMNVTIPFKSSVIPLLDGLDETARKVGAVNVVGRTTDGGRASRRFVGHNSDVDGIVTPLRERSMDLRRGRAILIGAGGAARAFVEAMGQLGCPVVIVVVRDRARAEGFVKEMALAHPGMDLQLCSFEQSSALRDNPVDLLFNGTPAGTAGKPMPSEVFRLMGPETTVFDAVYRPVETELVRRAAAQGCKVVRGYEMLLDQGAVAFELWTGKKAPIAVMREVILNHLIEKEEEERSC